MGDLPLEINEMADMCLDGLHRCCLGMVATERQILERYTDRIWYFSFEDAE